ncbi:NAD(P)-binding protein [Trematosphaeria pertusa]|uniref:NAD(P)-binding protein n=1 Tax=Trematosphaeria pertusa TaxID=390896 RepID=A0A6A6IJR4_9PLEO|nr:NAD(P)-binding protein [Trematosphaeria pertusa]KAF2249783.1 NAD(P)-binding protein [Trematosphaeria pertusa]
MPPTVFITGVSSGLGLTLASYALKQGAIVLGTVRNPQRASSALSQLSSISSNFYPITLDVTDLARIPTVADQAIKDHGPIDVLINNAGYSVIGPLEHITSEQAKQQMETNYFGPLALIQAMLPHFRARRTGTIINVSSVAGLNGLPSCGLYAASKFALEGTSEAIAAELAPLGIRTIIVEPGGFRTDFLTSTNMVLANKGEGWAEEYRGDNPAQAVLQKLQSWSGKQPGDPKKAAHALWDVITDTGMGAELKEKGRDGKVMRVLLGSDSLGRLKSAIDMRQDAMQYSEAVAKSCDY